MLLINRKFEGFEMALAPGIFGVHEPDFRDASSPSPEDVVYLRELREEKERIEYVLSTLPLLSLRYGELYQKFLAIECEIMHLSGASQ